MFTKLKNKQSDSVFCKECWFGNSRDGLLTNGEGYNYFEMKTTGEVVKAFEFYETEDGEEKVFELPELIGINWFSYFGFEDDDILDVVNIGEFMWVEDLQRKAAA